MRNFTFPNPIAHEIITSIEMRINYIETGSVNMGAADIQKRDKIFISQLAKSGVFIRALDENQMILILELRKAINQLRGQP